MGKNSGYLVKWTDKNGNEKQGVAIHREQDVAFKNIKKLFVRHMTADFSDFEKDENGKKIVGLVDMEKCKQCGMYD